MNKNNPDKFSDIKIASIVAIAKNNAIGKNNGMIWHIPEDLRHFKRTTLGKPILMGRKSYESLGKPLPGRQNLVISRSFDTLDTDAATQVFNDMETAIGTSSAGDAIAAGPYLYSTIPAAIGAAKEMALQSGVDEIFITGGGQIYKETLPIVQRLYITVLDREYEGDVFFPEIDWDEWHISAESKHEAEPAADRPSFTFYTLDRK